MTRLAQSLSGRRLKYAALALGLAACTPPAPDVAITVNTTAPPSDEGALAVVASTTTTRVRVKAQSKPRPTVPVEPVERRTPAPVASPGEGWATASSTAYCLTGAMANGQPARQGAVAMNVVPLGTVIEVSASPFGPGRFVVEDRIGHGSQLDFALPGECGRAREWGRRAVQWKVAA